MTFNQRITCFSFFLITISLVGGIWYYKKTHPIYIPLLPKPEVTITIIPGWNLRQVADYLAEEGFASTTEDLYQLTGRPAYDYRRVASVLPKIEDLKILEEKPAHVSYEGYLAPETYRVFKDATTLDILKKLVSQREKEITEEMWVDIKKSGKSLYEILTMASILEKEVQTPEDKAKVADILWRRLERGWALQVDSSVHYAVDKTGNVFTTDKERDVDSPWNTYKYPGLPLGPISNPGLDSIKAALYPEKNNYWYFLTGKDGTVHYGRTLDEHNANKFKYLR
ncbi:MAG: endolytic transglycosylase MltG [Candidatus Magasanikbacteria bacterium]|nr:endolytic transglycosylase MltG [Candidatus Magasanikbacteria bacterium]